MFFVFLFSEKNRVLKIFLSSSQFLFTFMDLFTILIWNSNKKSHYDRLQDALLLFQSPAPVETRVPTSTADRNHSPSRRRRLCLSSYWRITGRGRSTCRYTPTSRCGWRLTATRAGNPTTTTR